MPANRRSTLLLAVLAGTVAAHVPVPRDLDIGLPPGSPLDLAAGYLSVSPRDTGALAVSPGAERSDPERSTSAPPTRSRPLPGLAAHAQVRILTWDLAGYLTWMQRGRMPDTVDPGHYGRGAVEYGDGAYWVTLAPLLRLLLHPEHVTRSETLAHLLQIGDPALLALGAALEEPRLREEARDLRHRILFGTGQPLPPLDPERPPTERMWRRFVRTELLAAYPYDPEDDFGARLDLYREEVEPHVLALAATDHLELRRAAVAYLARSSSPEALTALAHVASGVADGVCLMRALDGLARFGGRIPVGPLVARLGKTRDPIERTALLRTLGRAGRAEGVPVMLELGREAVREQDSDLLIPVLDGLIRVPFGERAKEVRELTQRIERSLSRQGKAYRSKRSVPYRVDRPDDEGVRARILGQLNLLLRARLDPGDGELETELLGLVRDEPVRMRPPGRDPLASPATVNPLGGLPPRVRWLYLERLGRLGDAGHDRLLRTARGNGLDHDLRRRALRALPLSTRDELALELVGAKEEDPLQQAAAFELLLSDRHRSARELAARRVLDVAPEGSELPAAKRYEIALAVRFLEREGVLTARILEPLLTRLTGALVPTPELELWLTSSLDELIEAALAGKKQRRRIRSFLEECERRGIEDAGRHAGYLREVLSAVKPGARADWLDSLRGHMQARLLGREYEVPAPRVFAAPRSAIFDPPVPLLRDVLLALGGTGEDAALERLGGLTEELEGKPRELAALGLGRSGRMEAVRWLVPLLLDGEPAVRLAADAALLHLGAPPVDIDWLESSVEERSRAAEARFAWSVRRPR